jgi:hypothetical protein
MNTRRGFHSILFAVCLCAGSSESFAQTQILGPTPYLCFDTDASEATGDCAGKDSPFKDVAFDWFYFEDYEDDSLASPGVTLRTEHCGNAPPSLGCPIIADHFYPGNLTDSVDEDDGAIDGLGQTVVTGGKSVWGVYYLRVDFDAAALGSLPTHAGFAWTDGQIGTTTEFRAWDGNGNLLGFVQAFLEDGTNLGTTVDDHFFGVIHEGGISAIEARNNGGVEIDHLQYGSAAGPALAARIDASADRGPTCINLRSRGATRVTTFGSEALDVAAIDLASLRFNGLEVRRQGNGRPACSIADADLDGAADLACDFQLDANLWSGSNMVGTLTGRLAGGTPIEGTDAICVK